MKHVIGQCVTILTINFTITGQVKLGIHAMRLCQISSGSGSNVNIKNDTLMSLLSLLDSSIAFNSIFLRHHIFCIIQILSGRWACFAFFFFFGLNSFFSAIPLVFDGLYMLQVAF